MTILQTGNEHGIWEEGLLTKSVKENLHKRKTVEWIIHYRKYMDGNHVHENMCNIPVIRVPQSLKGTHMFISG